MEGDLKSIREDTAKVLVSVETLSEVWAIDVPVTDSVASLLALLSEKHGRPEVTAMDVTVEDGEEPVTPSDTLSTVFNGAKRGRIHLHCCKEVDVTIEYNSKSHSKSFSPASTVHRVFKWAMSAQAFNLETEAHDLELQLPGATSALPQSTHIGTIAAACQLKLELVPKDRPQGCAPK